MDTAQNNTSHRRVLLGIIGITVCVGMGAFWYVTWHGSTHTERSVVRIGDRRFLVEFADTPVLRERGLGYRDSLPSGHGMLFLFPEDTTGRHSFWMKGMRFPLDIAWIHDGRVVHIERNIPADSEDIFRPKAEADSVLEVNAGDLSRIVIGDAVVVSE